MKQLITLEQVKELTEDQTKKLEAWWKENSIDLDHIILGNEIYPQLRLNIGQMIWFLGYKWELAILNDGGREGQWVTYPENLCDALWKAVKEHLSKRD